MTKVSVSHFPSGQAVAAQLVTDTATRTAVGVRSAGLGTRQMLFQVDDAEVLLQIRPGKDGGRLQVMGQVLDAGLPSEAAGIELYGPDGEIDSMTDDEGEFRVDSLPKGDYALTVSTADFLLHMPSVTLH